MNKYEVLYIIDAALDDAAKDALVERFSKLVTDNAGEVESVDKWGVRKFAYEMNFKNEGYYVLMNFSANPDLPAEMERQMRISDDVIRYLVVRK